MGDTSVSSNYRGITISSVIGPLSEKASFIKDLHSQYPFITKYSDKLNNIKKLHLKFYKWVLGVNFKTTNLAVYADLGRYPILVNTITACLKSIHYIEEETDNTFLKAFNHMLLQFPDLLDKCAIFKMKNQLCNHIHMHTSGMKKDH